MMMPSIFGNNFVDDVFDDMFPFTGNYTTANYDLMKTDVKDAGDHYELEMEMPGVEKENCKDVYFPNADTNTKCQTYAITYEEMVNSVINDIKQVNQNIEDYNKYNEENNTGIPPIQKYNTTKKYIDFNNDKEYAGKEDF